jgi:gliding motility-associated-like protein
LLPNTWCGRGAPANAGGGGIDHNSGGGGGGNGGAGGFGGYQLEACSPVLFDNRGIGGRSLAYSNATNRIYFGGGGGAGHCNQFGGMNLNGGNGGGIVLARAGVLLFNAQKIAARGENATQCALPNIDNCHDGSGGGGAGGTVLVEANEYSANSLVEVSGGKGGDLIVFNNLGGGRIGPGGGGAGGVVWINNAALPAGMTVNNTGGLNGVISPDNNNPWGATPGETGINLFNLVVPVTTVLFEKNIDTVTLSSTITSCKNVRFEGNAIIRSANITNWQWHFGDGNIVNSQTAIVTHGYATGGNYTARLVVTDLNGCKDSVSLPVMIDTVLAAADAVAPRCPGEQTVLNARGGIAFSWTPAQYLDDPGSATPVATVDTSTLFIVTVSNSQGCSDTASVRLNIHQPPLFAAPEAPPTSCSKIPVQLKGNNGAQVTYAWSPALYMDDPTSAAPIVSPDTSMHYQLTVTGPVCGFDSTFSVFVNVAPTPIVEINKLNDIDCAILTAPLQATGATSYTWTPAIGLSDPAISNPVASPTETTTYIVTGISQDGCIGRDTVTVQVTNDGKAIFEVPNAFSPNGDGRNDCFGIKKWANVTVHEFSVFNRWGQLVFATKNPSVCWDGTVNGKQQDTGGYTYVIKASSRCGNIKRTGIVMLVR